MYVNLIIEEILTTKSFHTIQLFNKKLLWAVYKSRYEKYLHLVKKVSYNSSRTQNMELSYHTIRRKCTLSLESASQQY